MAPETTQMEHACGVSRINHQDHNPAQNSHRNGVTANTVTPAVGMPTHGTSEYLR